MAFTRQYYRGILHRISIRYSSFLLICLCLGPLCCEALSLNEPAFNAEKNTIGQNNKNTDTLRLYKESDTYNIYSSYTNAHVVHDPNKLWSIDDFKSGHKDIQELLRQPASKIEATGDTYWLLITVDNQHPKSQWRLNFQHGRTDFIEVLVIPQNGSPSTIERGGMQSSPAKRSIASLGYTLPVNLPQGETSTIVIRVYSYLYEGGLYVYLEEADHNTTSGFVYHVEVLLLLGLMLGMSGYNLFICLVTRDITYFWYSLVAASLTLTWASYYGLTWSIFGWNDPNRYITIFSQIGVVVFTLFFVSSFLNLPKTFKIFNYAFWLCNVYLLVISVATFFYHPAYIFLAFWAITLLGTILILTISIACILKGNRAARFLLGGQALVAVGTFETGLAIFGIMPYEDPAPHHFTAMSAGEMLLLSMALADRINQLRNEKRIAEKANELKSSFLALMSHEIRTPLNGLLSMIKLLGKSVLNKRQRSYVEAMDYSGNALLSMLNSLLDYSKIEAQDIELERIEFDPRLLLESLVMLMSARASEKGLILSTKIDKQLPLHVTGDPNRLRQILLNLIGNAIKFTNRGVIQVCVRQLTRSNDVASIQFKIQDSGIGIAPEVQARVFDVFTQADTSITRRFGGTGLGLSICKRLVELMGGELTLESEVGKGSAFYFTLDMPYSLAPRQNTQKTLFSATKMPSLQVLLVDDVELNRVAAAGLLEHEGHRVTLAGSAKEALQKLQQNHFDIILMDIHMPDMDGLTATQHIRQQPDPVKAAIPVIALTANASSEQHQQYLAVGINKVVSKPLEVDELLAAIASSVNRQGSELTPHPVSI